MTDDHKNNFGSDIYNLMVANVCDSMELLKQGITGHKWTPIDDDGNQVYWTHTLQTDKTAVFLANTRYSMYIKDTKSYKFLTPISVEDATRYVSPATEYYIPGETLISFKSYDVYAEYPVFQRSGGFPDRTLRRSLEITVGGVPQEIVYSNAFDTKWFDSVGRYQMDAKLEDDDLGEFYLNAMSINAIAYTLPRLAKYLNYRNWRLRLMVNAALSTMVDKFVITYPTTDTVTIGSPVYSYTSTKDKFFQAFLTEDTKFLAGKTYYKVDSVTGTLTIRPVSASEIGKDITETLYEKYATTKTYYTRSVSGRRESYSVYADTFGVPIRNEQSLVYKRSDDTVVDPTKHYYTTTDYVNFTEVHPVGTENPSSLGWYELANTDYATYYEQSVRYKTEYHEVEGHFVETTDTTSQEGKTYYIREDKSEAGATEPVYQFTAIPMDVGTSLLSDTYYELELDPASVEWSGNREDPQTHRFYVPIASGTKVTSGYTYVYPGNAGEEYKTCSLLVEPTGGHYYYRLKNADSTYSYHQIIEHEIGKICEDADWDRYIYVKTATSDFEVVGKTYGYDTVIVDLTKNKTYTSISDCVLFRQLVVGDDTSIMTSKLGYLYVDATDEVLTRVKNALNVFMTYYRTTLLMSNRSGTAYRLISDNTQYTTEDIIIRLNSIIGSINKYATHPIAELEMDEYTVRNLKLKVNELIEYVVDEEYYGNLCKDTSEFERNLRDFEKDFWDKYMDSGQLQYNMATTSVTPAKNMFLTEDDTYQEGKSYYSKSDTTYTLLVVDEDYEVGDEIEGAVYEGQEPTLSYNDCLFYYEPRLPYIRYIYNKIKWNTLCDTIDTPEVGDIKKEVIVGADGSSMDYYYVFVGTYPEAGGTYYGWVPMHYIVNLYQITEAWSFSEYSASMQVLQLTKNLLETKTPDGNDWKDALSNPRKRGTTYEYIETSDTIATRASTDADPYYYYKLGDDYITLIVAAGDILATKVVEQGGKLPVYITNFAYVLGQINRMEERIDKLLKLAPKAARVMVDIFRWCASYNYSSMEQCFPYGK